MPALRFRVFSVFPGRIARAIGCEFTRCGGAEGAQGLAFRDTGFEFSAFQHPASGFFLSRDSRFSRAHSVRARSFHSHTQAALSLRYLL